MICEGRYDNVTNNGKEKNKINKNTQQFLRVRCYFTHPGRIIESNRPNIVIKEFKQQKCYLKDTILPSDKNISSNEFDNFAKCKDLQI